MFKSLCLILFLVQSIYGSCKLCNGPINVVPVQTPKTNFIAGTIWNAKTQSLYAVDFVSPHGTYSIYRYDYNTGQFYGAEIVGEESPSFIYPIEGCENEFVVGFLGVVKVIHWDGKSTKATVLRTLFTAYGHMNYAYADKKGRLFTGTLNRTIYCSAPAEFATYRYANDKLTKIFSNIRATTGLTIDQKRNIFYHADACRYQIVAFDYDCKTGDICNGRVVYDFRNSGITPLPLVLGLNVDRNGYLWCTLYESGLLVIIDPKTSTIIKRIEFPSLGLSEISFGGPNYDQIFVTSTRILVNPYGGGVLQNRSQDATLFKVEGLNARGFDTPSVRLGSLGCKNNKCCSK